MTEDFAKIKAALAKLPDAIQNNVVSGATRAAAVAISEDAKRRVPVKTGLLKSTIGVAKAKKKDTKNGHVKYYVITKSKLAKSAKVKLADGRTGKMKLKVFAFYAHMVEFGTSKMAAKPFMRPAYKNSAETSVKAFQDYSMKRIDKEVEKLKR